MTRLVALALAGAFVLGVGPTEDRRSAKEKYVAVVRGTVQEERLARLLDEVIDFDRVGCQVPHGLCARDTKTLVGVRWIRAEERLQAEMGAVVERLEGLSRPRAVADEHAAFVAALRDCVTGIPPLESELPPADNISAVHAFDEAVADTVECFPRLYQIAVKFDAKGYPFLPGSLGTLVDAYGYYGPIG